jgi:hypothetical protein
MAMSRGDLRLFTSKGDETMDRERSPAWQALPDCAKRAFYAIQREIGTGTSAKLSYPALMVDARIGRQSIPRSLKALRELGLLSIATGARSANVFSLSEAWREIDEDAAQRIVSSALPPPSQRPRPKRPRPTFDALLAGARI